MSGQDHSEKGELTTQCQLVYYAGNYSTYVKTKTENEINQMKAYHKQQEEIAHIKKSALGTPARLHSLPTSACFTYLIYFFRFIASAGTYANLVKQAKSKQKIIDKMEAAGLIEKVETVRPLRFNFEDIRKLPPPVVAFDSVAFSYSGKKEDYLYQNLSFGIEYVL